MLIKRVNDIEINDFVDLTKGQDISVKFIEFIPFKGTIWDWDKEVSKEEIKVHL